MTNKESALINQPHALLSLMDRVLEVVRVSSGEIPLLKQKSNLAKSLEHNDSGIDDDEDLKTETPYITPVSHPLTSTSKTASVKPTVTTTRVLVIEDNLIAQQVAEALLSQLTCHVDIASNGEDALALFEQNEYDLIFMDIGLGGGMDGYEVTHHIRQQSNANKNTPIIALTAHASEDNKQRCMEAEMDAVLTKPLSQAYATDIIQTFIPTKRAEALSIMPTHMKRDLPDCEAELFQLEQFALLDDAQALKNCEDNPAMLREMLTLMMKEVPTDLEEMKKAYAANDYSLVEKIAHKIKGDAVYVGTTRMKYACQYVDRYWKTGEHLLFAKLYQQAVDVIEHTSVFVNEWLKRNV